MSFEKKTWTDRLAEFIGRRKLTNVSTEEEITVDVSRAEGEILQAGDPFSAQNMNDLEERISAGFDKLNENLTDYIIERSVTFNAYSLTINAPVTLKKVCPSVDGYTPIVAMCKNTGNGNVYCAGCYLSGGYVYMVIGSDYTTISSQANAQACVLYRRTV